MMSEAKLEILKKSYPVGTRVVLDHMDDKQAPPRGTGGEVIAIDGMGTIHVKWDNGCGLGLVYGIDGFHKESNDKHR